MKNKFLSFILCFSLIICSLIFIGGCNTKNYSKQDVAELYTSIKTSNQTKQFFDGDKLTITFEGVDLTEDNPGYIFELVYDYYLQSSSGFLTSILNRVGKMSYAIKDFNQEQTNLFYNKLYDVKLKLEDLYVSKTIYESSGGNLHYKALLLDYNSLLSSLYNLNNTYADYYFTSVGKVNFASDELTNGNIRDFLWKQLLVLSNASFNHELLNFVPSNPMGEVKNSWYLKTENLQKYVNMSKRTLMALNSSGDLSLLVLSNSENMKETFASIQTQENNYNLEYNLVKNNLSKFNFKEYFNSNYKQAYLANCSNTQKSAYNIVKNFFEGKYLARVNAINLVNNYLGV